MTPRHYVEFINQFVKIYNEKRTELEEQQQHLNVGVKKIEVRRMNSMLLLFYLLYKRNFSHSYIFNCPGHCASGGRNANAVGGEE